MFSRPLLLVHLIIIFFILQICDARYAICIRKFTLLAQLYCYLGIVSLRLYVRSLNDDNNSKSNMHSDSQYIL
jgi:hypothetical protein